MYFNFVCDPMDCSPPGSSVHGILQARILEWLPFPPPGDLPDPGIEPAPVALVSSFSTTAPFAEPNVYMVTVNRCNPHEQKLTGVINSF